MNELTLKEKLFSLKDEKYRQFHIPLIPTVNAERVIGIRTPILRAFCKEFSKEDYAKSFLEDLPHYYYEENNLHAFLIENCKDYHHCVQLLNEFLPFVDNWATCDMMNPKVLLKNRDLLFSTVINFLKSDHVYQVRFGIVCAMRAFTGEFFNREIAEKISSIKTDEYYVNSAIGWFFATLLTKNYDSALPFIEQNALSITAHNLAIKKARESLCVSKERKDYLNSLKMKVK